MDNFMTGMVAIATAIVGVAVVAVLVSRNSQTPSVIGAATGGFAQDLAAAVSPVTSSGLGMGMPLGGYGMGGMGYGTNGMIGGSFGTVY